MAALFFKPFGEFFCPEDRPSPVFTTFSVCMHVLGGILGLAGLLNSEWCPQHITTWIIVGLATMFGNVIFAFYIYVRFSAKVKETGSGSSAAGKLFLYDWGVCMYWVFLVWQIVWLVVANNKSGNSDAECTGTLSNMTLIFVLYYLIGGVLIFLSLVTECCRTPSWHQNQRGAAGRAAQAVYAAPAPGRTAAYQPGPSPIMGGGGQQGQTQPGYAQPTGTPQGGSSTAPTPAAGPPPTNPNFKPQSHDV